VKYYQKWVKVACNYFENSSASGGLRPYPRPPTGALPLDPAARWGTPVPQNPSGFAPHPKRPSAAYDLNTSFLAAVASSIMTTGSVLAASMIWLQASGATTIVH